jgi:recombination protein RecA
MSQALRKIAGNVSKTGSIVLFLNQLRSKIGGIGYGPQETTTGGNALKFYASVRLDIRRVQTLKKGAEEYGIRARVKVVKNKVAPPFRRAEFDIIFGQGISNIGCIIDLAEEMGILKRRGSWYSYKEENVAQGRDNLVVYLKENPEILAEVEGAVREKLSSGVPVSASQPGAMEDGEEEIDGAIFEGDEEF